MPFAIPNEADAPVHGDQAEIDNVDIDALVAGFARTGVITGCGVTDKGASQGLTVTVAAGTAAVDGTLVAVASGDLTPGAADGTNPRFDLVVVSNAGTKSIIAGTAAANPVFPEIPANSALLAVVYIPAGLTEVTSSHITDKRVMLATGNVNVQPFTASGTWTKPAGAYQEVEVIVIAGGSGGGSGRRGAAGTVRCGGGGGAGGGWSRQVFPIAVCGATETVTVGAGGAGGAAVTVNDTNGNAGAIGGVSSFGTTAFVRADTSAANGAGGTAASGTGGTGGRGVSQGGGGANASSIGLAGTAPATQLLNAESPTGGGSGGGISSGDTPSSGGNGGTSVLKGLAGGTGGSAGGAGAAGGAVATNEPSGGRGGGGGASSITAAAGAGGDGGLYGAGGGGGGASLNGNNSGAGGAGVDGFVLVITR